MSYQTSSKLSRSFWLLIGARKLLCFSAQSEGRTAATVWNWSGKTLFPGALLVVRQGLAGRQAIYLIDIAKSHAQAAHETRRESARLSRALVRSLAGRALSQG